MAEEDVVKGRSTPNSEPEPDGWSTRCWWCPWRGRCEGAGGHGEMQAQAAAQQQAHTQSTRVEFFTVAREAGTDRGEDEDAP